MPPVEVWRERLPNDRRIVHTFWGGRLAAVRDLPELRHTTHVCLSSPALINRYVKESHVDVSKQTTTIFIIKQRVLLVGVYFFILGVVD